MIVSDMSTYAIKVYNGDTTNVLLQFGLIGSADAQFKEHPYYICLNSKGHLIVSDKSNHRIQVFQ